MRLSKKLAVGISAGAIPILLLGASPAAAAFKGDDDGRVVTYTSTGGSTLNCTLSADHTVDSTSGELTASLSTSISTCRGGLGIVTDYVDGNGERVRSAASAAGTSSLTLKEFNAGSTAVNVSYVVQLANCTNNCSHSLQTATK